MKKIFISIMFIAFAGYGVLKTMKNTEKMSPILLANIEALALYEYGTTPYVVKCYKTIHCENTTVREEKSLLR